MMAKIKGRVGKTEYAKENVHTNFTGLNAKLMVF